MVDDFKKSINYWNDKNDIDTTNLKDVVGNYLAVIIEGDIIMRHQHTIRNYLIPICGKKYLIV